MWNHVLHALFQGGKAAVEWCIEKHQERQPSGRYDFQRHMQFLTEQTGIALVSLKPGRASFMPRLNGIEYVTVASLHGETIRIGVFSNIKFRTGCIPHAVTSRFGSLSLPDDGFMLDTIDVDRAQGSFVIADTGGPALGLSADTFSEVLERMMKRLRFIDAWMEEEGFAN